jgi:tetratricopeptide (TPR) repeat protein
VAGSRGAKAAYDLQLKQADEELALGYLEKAAQSIGRALPAARSERDYLRLLKRAYRIAVSGGDFSLLQSIAGRAAERIPGSSPLRQVFAFVSLRAGDDPRPITGLNKDLLKSKDAQYLMAEAIMRGWSPPESSGRLDPELRSLLSLEDQTDPLRLQEQGTERSDGRILLDAALLWMKQGDAQSAHVAVQGEWSVPVPPEPRIFIALDAGKYEECAALIDRLPGSASRYDLQLIKADALRALGREQEAAAIYQRVAGGNARFFWSPYLNLARIADQEGDASAAEQLRRRAFELFPESGPVLLDYGGSLLRAGETDAAVKLLEQLLRRDPQNLSARFLLLQAAAQNQPGQRYQAGLWSLFNEHPHSPLLCRLLAQQLLAEEDAQGAAAILDRFELPAGGQPPPWLLELKGIAEALGGEYTKAASLLEASLEQLKSWRSRYNLAVVYRGEGNLEKSVNELLQAADELERAESRGSAISKRRHSRIRSMAGEILLRMGKTDAARRESAYALELDPGNGQALLVLRMLEGK